MSGGSSFENVDREAVWRGPPNRSRRFHAGGRASPRQPTERKRRGVRLRPHAHHPPLCCHCSPSAETHGARARGHVSIKPSSWGTEQHREQKAVGLERQQEDTQHATDSDNCRGLATRVCGSCPWSYQEGGRRLVCAPGCVAFTVGSEGFHV